MTHRTEKQKRLKKKYEDVDDMDHLTDKKKRDEKRFWKRQMSKLFRREGKQNLKDEGY